MPKISEVRKKMILWDVWRQTGRVAATIDWPKLCATGKFMDGIKGTKCGTCHGSGKVSGYTYNQVAHKVTCRACHGEGKIKLEKRNSKINPAFITATNRGIDDSEMLVIDCLMCSMKNSKNNHQLYLALIYEYTKNGTQASKAKKAKVSVSYYEKRLMEAHRAVKTALNNYLTKKGKSAILI